MTEKQFVRNLERLMNHIQLEDFVLVCKKSGQWGMYFPDTEGEARETLERFLSSTTPTPAVTQ